MRKYAVKKIGKVNGENDEVYILNAPSPGEDGFYRQITSLSAFFFEHSRNLKRRNETKDILWICEPWAEFEIRQKIDTKWGIARKISDRVFNSIWEFYEFVGYDYKTKKWNK